jgi:hypothetical protein
MIGEDILIFIVGLLADYGHNNDRDGNVGRCTECYYYSRGVLVDDVEGVHDCCVLVTFIYTADIWARLPIYRK